MLQSCCKVCNILALLCRVIKFLGDKSLQSQIPRLIGLQSWQDPAKADGESHYTAVASGCFRQTLWTEAYHSTGEAPQTRQDCRDLQAQHDYIQLHMFSIAVSLLFSNTGLKVVLLCMQHMLGFSHQETCMPGKITCKKERQPLTSWVT